MIRKKKRKKNDDGLKSLSVKTSKELNAEKNSFFKRTDDNIVNLIFIIFMKFWLKMIRTGVPLF